MTTPILVEGDLLEQPVDVIVNAWNRNIIPWWLLIPQGVSGAIKKRAGRQPFFEIGRVGAMPIGTARLTSAGRLPYKGIIHVAAINMLWRGSKTSIQRSVENALALAEQQNYASIAFPILGSGSGGYNADQALSLMQSTIVAATTKSIERVIIVRFKP
jgi:O-acetyl-ADP-ribose deacetylase